MHTQRVQKERYAVYIYPPIIFSQVVFHSVTGPFRDKFYPPSHSRPRLGPLQAMVGAKEGVYCGPLRLLAMEVYDECNASGTFCSLVTGGAPRPQAPLNLASNSHLLLQPCMHLRRVERGC